MKRLTPLLLICSALLIVVIQGCTLHTVRPAATDTSIPESYNGSNTEATGWQAEQQWWRRFNDEQLNRLMAQALAGNLDLAQFTARLRQAMALSRQRQADRMPRLTLDGSASRSQQVNADGESVGTNSSYALSAGYEVDLWNKLGSIAEAQLLEQRATRQDLYTLYLTLSAQVAENYFRLVELRARLDLIDQTISARTDNLELVELRYREGMVTALDLYQARQNLANARAQRPDVESDLATTAHALAVLTGGYPTETIGGTLSELPDMSESFPLGLPSDLLKQRPDIQAANLRLEAADHQIAAAVADRFPSINLLADYGRSRSDFGSVISGTVWNLVGNLTMPLIDFNKRKAEVDRNEAVYAERLAAYQQTVLNAFQDVEDALVANRQSEASIAKIGIEVSAAGDALRLAVAEYRDGLSTYLPVLTAQTTYFDSQTRLLSARRQLISARISLARAMGGTWMTELADERLQAQKQNRTDSSESAKRTVQ